MVWPLPLYRFVTQRVADFIRQQKLTGCELIPVERLEFIGDGFSPGGLSSYMPQKRARELGEPLGIY